MGPGFKELRMVAVQDLLGGYPFLVRPDGDRCAMAIASGYHQDLIAFEPMVSGEDIGSQVAARKMTQMQRPVGVGPSDRHQDTFRQRRMYPSRPDAV